MPLSERLTLSISDAWRSIERFLWTTPMPPSRASAIAISDSVTVSIAALTIGISSSMWREKRVRVATSRGCTSASRGTSRTSSKVSASGPTLSPQATRAASEDPASPGVGRRSIFSAHITRSAMARCPPRSRAARRVRHGRRSLLLRVRQLLRRVALQAAGIEIVVPADPELGGAEEAVVAGRELLVTLREHPVRSGRELEARRRQRLEEALDAELGGHARVDAAMAYEALGIDEHLTMVLDPDPVE